MSSSFDDQLKEYKSLDMSYFEQGKNHGIEELPATPDTQFNASQVELKIKAQKIGRNLIQQTRIQILEYENIISNNEVILKESISIPNIENLKINTSQKYTSFLSNEKFNFINYYINYLTSRNNLDRFKTERGITTEIQISPISAKAHYMVLIAYGIIETILNIFIFNGGLSLIDSLILSSFISILNIYPAVLVGNFFRNINSNDKSNARNAYILLIIWIIFTLWLNTSLGILRSYLTELSLQTVNVTSISDIFKSNAIYEIFFNYAFNIFILKAPPIKDALSIFLWLVGIFAAILSCIKGYSSDEKIPELGQYIRNFKENEDTFKITDSQLRGEISKIFAENNNNISKIRNDFDRSIRDYKATFLLIRKNIVEFNRKIKELENEFIVLIKIYRDGNKSTRNSFPPIYFQDNKPTLDLEDEYPDFLKYSEDFVMKNLKELESLYSIKTDDLNNLQSQYNAYIQLEMKSFELELENYKNEARETLGRPF